MTIIDPAPAYSVPYFRDDDAVALAIAETNLPEAPVRLVVEAQAWFLIVAGIMLCEGPDVEARRLEAQALFPGRFDDPDPAHPAFTYDEEAEYIVATTGLAPETVTLVLTAVRLYEEQLGIVDDSAVSDYRAWCESWLAARA